MSSSLSLFYYLVPVKKNRNVLILTSMLKRLTRLQSAEPAPIGTESTLITAPTSIISGSSPVPTIYAIRSELFVNFVQATLACQENARTENVSQ